MDSTVLIVTRSAMLPFLLNDIQPEERPPRRRLDLRQVEEGKILVRQHYVPVDVR